MDIGHITQLATDQLGRSKVVYRQDLTRPQGVAHLKVDDLGAGDFVFVDTGAAGSNPAHAYTPDGLVLSIERPPAAAGNIGEWAAAPTQNVAVPDRVLLLATFDQPSRVSLGTAPAAGTYAASLLLNTGTLMGVTMQFRPEGVRLNLPGTGLMPNRPPISQTFVDRILDPRHPSVFSLALTLHRTTAGAAGKGFLFIGNDEADAFAFTGFPPTTPLIDIRAGIGTANGSGYRASVRLLDFQIWTAAD